MRGMWLSINHRWIDSLSLSFSTVSQIVRGEGGVTTDMSVACTRDSPPLNENNSWLRWFIEWWADRMTCRFNVSCCVDALTENKWTPRRQLIVHIHASMQSKTMRRRRQRRRRGGGGRRRRRRGRGEKNDGQTWETHLLYNRTERRHLSIKFFSSRSPVSREEKNAEVEKEEEEKRTNEPKSK